VGEWTWVDYMSHLHLCTHLLTPSGIFEIELLSNS
jgi:hypothetical protein